MKPSLVTASGTWLAWISDTTGANEPAQRFAQGDSAYVLMTGTIIATSWADLIDGSLQNPINADENGTPVEGLTWTGTTAIGTAKAAPVTDTCNDWASSEANGVVGSMSNTDVGWTDAYTWDCNIWHSVYCFDQDEWVPAVPE